MLALLFEEVVTVAGLHEGSSSLISGGLGLVGGYDRDGECHQLASCVQSCWLPISFRCRWTVWILNMTRVKGQEYWKYHLSVCAGWMEQAYTPCYHSFNLLLILLDLSHWCQHILNNNWKFVVHVLCFTSRSCFAHCYVSMLLEASTSVFVCLFVCFLSTLTFMLLVFCFPLLSRDRDKCRSVSLLACA